MNTLIVVLAEIFLTVAVLAAGFFGFRRKVSVLRLACCGALIVSFAVVARGASELLPPLRDKMTLTALGEKSAEAGAEEICFSGCTIDGQTYAADGSVRILQGKWIWCSGNYFWRIESDTRRPEGVTRELVVAVPVGRDRTLNFESSAWRGYVRIDDGVSITSVDTYSAEKSNVSVPVADSAESRLVLDQVRCLALYVAVFLALSAFVFLALRRQKAFDAYQDRHEGEIAFFLIAAFQFLLAFHYGGIDCLWFDELWEFAWNVQSDSFLSRAFVDSVPRPISESIIGLWTTYAPYGEKWLMILPELWTAAGIYFVGMCGKVYSGTRAGVMAALFAAASSVLLQQCSYEMRSYGLYFMTAAIVLYFYLKRYKTPERYTRADNVCFTIALVVFSQCHYYAYVICAALFVLELIGAWRKIRKVNIVPYIVMGVCTIPSAYMVLKSGFISNYTSSDWQPVPSLSSLVDLVGYLAAWSNPLKFLFALGAAFIVAGVVYAQKKEENCSERFICAIPLALMGIVVTFFVVYGNFIKPDATLWQNRYFCGLLPCFYVACGYGVDILCEWVGQRATREKMISAAICVLICLVVLPQGLVSFVSTAKTVRQPYREAADLIYSYIDEIYNDTTIILSAGFEEDLLGWNDYYLTRRGQRDAVNFATESKTPDEEILQYDTLFVQTIMYPLSGRVQNLIDTYYQWVDGSAEYGVNVYKRK